MAKCMTAEFFLSLITSTIKSYVVKTRLIASILKTRLIPVKSILVSIIVLNFCSPIISHANTQTILVLGDSLSAAYNLKVNEGWVALLENKLKQSEHFTHYRVINASISGATTAAGLNVLPQLLEQHKPILTLLELGANDGLQGNAIPYITNNPRRLIELCKQQNSQVVLIGIRLPPNYGAAYTKPFFEQFKNLAAEYNLAYLPFMLEGVAGNDALMQDDRLHPNAKAQPLILNNIWPILQPLIKPESH